MLRILRSLSKTLEPSGGGVNSKEELEVIEFASNVFILRSKNGKTEPSILDKGGNIINSHIEGGKSFRTPEEAKKFGEKHGYKVEVPK